MTASRTAGLLMAILALACNGTEPCELQDTSYPVVTSGSATGSRVLSKAGDALEIPLRITLSDLPEIWVPDQPIIGGELRVLVTQLYTTGAPGGDGRTQMPRIVSLFEHVKPPIPDRNSYPAFPGPEPQAQSIPIFTRCGLDPGGPCCNDNHAVCSVSGTLFVMRMDGEPFPPVEVSIEASASAKLQLCRPAAEPELKLTEEP